MALLSRFSRLLHDPPPDLVFELSEAGLAYAKGWPQPTIASLPLEAGVLAPSPVRDNVVNPEALTSAIASVAGTNGTRKRRRTALILPDFAARVSVLDFDSFPSDPAEQASLVRFRVKKSVPFDVDTAAVVFDAQHLANSKRIEVAAAVISYEIVARYEAPFRALNLHPGYVTTSSLAALALLPADGLQLLAKRGGKVLSLALVEAGVLRLLRTVELPAVETVEILSVLFPTLAFVEDELGRQPDRIVTCGLDGQEAAITTEAALPVQPLRSRFGAVTQSNAGLMGFLETAGDL